MIELFIFGTDDLAIGKNIIQQALLLFYQYTDR